MITSLAYTALIYHLLGAICILVHALYSKLPISVLLFKDGLWTSRGRAHIQRLLHGISWRKWIHGSIVELRITILLYSRLCLVWLAPSLHLLLRMEAWRWFIHNIRLIKTRWGRYWKKLLFRHCVLIHILQHAFYHNFLLIHLELKLNYFIWIKYILFLQSSINMLK